MIWDRRKFLEELVDVVSRYGLYLQRCDVNYAGGAMELTVAAVKNSTSLTAVQLLRTNRQRAKIPAAATALKGRRVGEEGLGDSS